MDQVDYGTGEVGRPALMPPAVAKAIVQVMKGVRQLGTDDRNQHGGYNFVSTDKFYARLGPMMAEAGLLIMADELEHEVRVTETEERGGGTKKTGWLHVRYAITLAHESGALWGPFNRACIVVASGPQAFASAQSFILKYFLRALFLVPTGEKDEIDSQDKTDLPAGGPESPRPTGASTPLRDPAMGNVSAGLGARATNRAAPAPKPATNPDANAAWKRVRGELAAAMTEEEVDHVIRQGSADMQLIQQTSETAYNQVLEAAAARREKVKEPAGEMPI